MKSITILSALLLMCSSYAQERIKLEHEQLIQKKQVPVQPAKRVSGMVKVNLPEAPKQMWGEYIITSHSILSTQTAEKTTLNALKGSRVTLSETNFEGPHIQSFSFEIQEIEQMSSSDFIYRAFGRAIRAPEPNLPQAVSVHKTFQEKCYGIIQISNNKVAIPYQGVLLFLERS